MNNLPPSLMPQPQEQPQQQPQDLPVGHAVFYPLENAVGLIYETYSFVDGPQARPGVSVLLSNGNNLGGFSARDADQLLVPLGPTGLSYEFTNVGQLEADYQAGHFGLCFHFARVLLLANSL